MTIKRRGPVDAEGPADPVVVVLAESTGAEPAAALGEPPLRAVEEPPMPQAASTVATAREVAGAPQKRPAQRHGASVIADPCDH